MNDCRVIAEIYRTAAGLQPWSVLLTTLGAGFDASFAQVVGLHKPTGTIAFSLHSQCKTADAVADCLHEGDVVDDAALSHPRLSALRLVKDRSHSGDILLSNPRYQLVLPPCGCRPVLAGKLVDDTELMAVMALVRSLDDKAFSESDARRVERLTKHLAAAVDSLRREQESQADTLVGELLLRHSPRPSLLLGPGGEIRFANCAARRVLEAGTVLAIQDGRVVARTAESANRLRAALGSMLSGQSVRNGTGRIALGLRDAVSGRVVPTCLRHLDQGDPARPIAVKASVLMVLPSETDQLQPDPTTLSEVFGLTPGEARVASQLVGNRPPKGIATALGISVATVRNHIRRLLQKTGSRDLRDLTRQVTVVQGLNSL
jgi:DNA-binding CsgD family transcriptional regulator/GAF domain-containing protein